MSRYQYVKGDATVRTGGSHTTYSDGNTSINSNKCVRLCGEEGVKYGSAEKIEITDAAGPLRAFWSRDKEGTRRQEISEAYFGDTVYYHILTNPTVHNGRRAELTLTRRAEPAWNRRLREVFRGKEDDFNGNRIIETTTVQGRRITVRLELLESWKPLREERSDRIVELRWQTILFLERNQPFNIPHRAYLNVRCRSEEDLENRLFIRPSDYGHPEFFTTTGTRIAFTEMFADRQIGNASDITSQNSDSSALAALQKVLTPSAAEIADVMANDIPNRVTARAARRMGTAVDVALYLVELEQLNSRGGSISIPPFGVLKPWAKVSIATDLFVQREINEMEAHFEAYRRERLDRAKRRGVRVVEDLVVNQWRYWNGRRAAKTGVLPRGSVEYLMIGVSHETVAKIFEGEFRAIWQLEEMNNNPDVIILYKRMHNPNRQGTYMYIIETFFIDIMSFIR